jgi:prepilin signal peptidase PulO-like enzyme (type II secretory pathway)
MQNALAIFAQTIPGMPVAGGWLAPIVLLLLGSTAVIDARTARVPDPFIMGGLFCTIAAEGFSVDWPFAGQHLAIAFAFGFLLYLVNELWYRFMKCDAFGMGDAKWTVLAVSCFGPVAGLFAWVIGAWLALGWMAVMHVARRRPIERIHFAPFLFIGLCAGIYWLRLQ